MVLNRASYPPTLGACWMVESVKTLFFSLLQVRNRGGEYPGCVSLQAHLKAAVAAAVLECVCGAPLGPRPKPLGAPASSPSRRDCWAPNSQGTAGPLAARHACTSTPICRACDPPRTLSLARARLRTSRSLCGSACAGRFTLCDVLPTPSPASSSSTWGIVKIMVPFGVP